MPAKRKPKAVTTTLSTLDEVELQLTRIRTRLAADEAAEPLMKMSPNVYAKLSTEHRGLLKLKADLEHKQAVTEDAISHLPAWLALRDGIVKVVAGCEHCADEIANLLVEP